MLLDEDEIAEGVCSIKNMLTGEQVKLPAQKAAQHILSTLQEANGPIILEK